jgi:hypothetical protein
VDVVSIDRHHDLGYVNADEPDAAAHMREGLSCDNWLWAALDRGWVREVTLVRADGIWYDEYRTEPPQAPASLVQRVRRLRWSVWAEHAPRYADALLLVRSAPWSPPWMDEHFQRLCRRVAPSGVWADEVEGLPLLGGMDAREVRPWNETT